ncbi:MAG: hypothetical protein K9H06_03140, partial [Melioribacteraceae bacterium]|nr:hypothetical protein [Melioribacteraceae bacterium]
DPVTEYKLSDFFGTMSAYTVEDGFTVVDSAIISNDNLSAEFIVAVKGDQVIIDMNINSADTTFIKFKLADKYSLQFINAKDNKHGSYSASTDLEFKNYKNSSFIIMLNKVDAESKSINLFYSTNQNYTPAEELEIAISKK